MPTKRYGKVRRLLRKGKAKAVKRCPFTIKLLYETGEEKQPISLGVDAGSKVVGVSATTEKEVLYEAEVELRNDIVKNLSARREARRARRGRKTRHRKPRFKNRKRPEGWLTPSVRNKVETHLRIVDDIHKILPITNIIVEVAAFDIQKIKDPDIEGNQYQQGEQLGFWNVREYVLYRDGHTCQCCKGKSKDPVLNVHHIESRQAGGNAPNNLITLCETCHKAYHKGEIDLPEKIKRGASFKDAAFMGIMRWAFYNELKERYQNASLTYGYITKNTRIKNNLPKEHRTDARCISENPAAKPPEEWFYQKKVRCHNRQIHKMTIGKGGYRKRNQSEYITKGFRLYDKVLFKGQECFVFGRRKSGSMDVRTLSGDRISPCASHKKLQLLEARKTLLTERRNGNSSHG